MTSPAPQHPYKSVPFEHQRDALRACARPRFFGLFMEPGTGKTFVIINNAAFLYLRGLINCMIVFAPNGVHRNWRDELELHMPTVVPYDVYVWTSSDERKQFNKRQKVKERGERPAVSALRHFIECPGNHLRVLLINTESATVDLAKKAVALMQRKHPRNMVVVDESIDIASVSAKRSITIRAAGKRAMYRRILNGTPGSTPWHYYGQMAFLSYNILRVKNYAEYKERHAEWVERETFSRLDEKGEPQKFKVIAKDEKGNPIFKNLDLINKLVAPYTYRVTKEVLNLPAKLYTKRYVEMTSEQWRMYQELSQEYMTQFADGALVSAEHTLTRWLRLQQIVCGYVPPDDATEEEPARLIPGANPRLENLQDVVDRYKAKTIVWTRFRLDADLVVPRLKDQGLRVVRYDGSVGDDECEANKNEFQRGSADILVANAAKAGRGLTLTAAKHEVFYSNYFRLLLRLQAEDRVHRAGLEHPVLITDLVADRTIDVKILNALRTGMDVANILTGDPAKDWI